MKSFTVSPLPEGNPREKTQDRMPIRCKLRFMVNAAMGMVRRSVRKRTSNKDMENE